MTTDAENANAEDSELGQNRRPAVSGERPAKLFRYSGAQSNDEHVNVVARAKWTKGMDNGGEFDENSDLHIRVGDQTYQCHKYPLQRESEFFEGVAKWGKRASPGSGVKPISGYSTNRFSKGNAVSATDGEGIRTSNASDNNHMTDGSRDSSKSTTSSSPGGDTAKVSGATSKSDNITNSINNITNSDNITNNFENNSVHLSDLSDLLPASCLEDATIFETVLDFVYSTEQNVFRIPANKAFYLFRISETLGED
jgi:hypothetical protein